MMDPVQIASGQGRDYITPEDVDKSIRTGCPKETVQQKVLEVIGKIAQRDARGRKVGYGAEDPGLCAFVAATFDEERRHA